MVPGQQWRMCSPALVGTRWQAGPFCGHCFQVACVRAWIIKCLGMYRRSRGESLRGGEMGKPVHLKAREWMFSRRTLETKPASRNFPFVMCLLCLSHLFKHLYLHSRKCYLHVVAWGVTTQSQLGISMQKSEVSWPRSFKVFMHNWVLVQDLQVQRGAYLMCCWYVLLEYLPTLHLFV